MSSIGVSDNAFKGYETITSVSFNSNCSYVGENAFNGCVSLVEINRDNKITKIEYSAFADCSNLSYVDIPYCSDIQSDAFKGCSNLSSIGDFYVDFKVGASAFKNCEKLSDIKLENCTSIGENAFYDCSSIKEVTLNKCSYIGESAFMNCTNLERVYITTPSCSLSSNVFYIYDDQNGVRINDNVCFYFSADVFEKYECDSNDSDNTWCEYKDNMAKINSNTQIIYETIDNNKINLPELSNIDNDGYGNKYGWICFNEDLVSLNDKIFKDSTTLKHLELPSSCEQIGEYEFSGCENLESIRIPDTNALKYIDQFAFQDCKKLSKFIIPDTNTDIVNSIGEGAFAGCESLIEFKIPYMVESIGEGAFAGCEKLEKIDVSLASLDGKKIICNKTLICVLPSDNTRIYNISEIDKDITRLGEKCFYGNKNIRRVDIPSSIKSIGNNAFVGCTNLCEVHFHCESLENLPTIGKALFSEKEKDESESYFNPENENLKIFVPESFYDTLVSDSNSNYQYYKDYIYPMPNDKEIIIYCVDEGNSDEGNSELTQIGYIKINNTSGILNESWEKAEEIEKDKSHITMVIVGEGITEIGKSAFENFDNLNYIYLSDNITALNDRCFYNCHNLTKIHIPNGGSNIDNINHIKNNKGGSSSPSSVTFGTEVFYGCTNLAEFDSYYEGYVSNDNRCYINNNSRLIFFAQGNLSNSDISEYTLPDVISIGSSVFKDVFKNDKINKINISSETTYIGKSAFEGCSSISKICLHNKLETISKFAFNGCHIENVYIDDIAAWCNISFENSTSNPLYNGCNLYLNNKLVEELTIPDSITKIGNFTFYNCSSLKSVNIPDSVNKIGDFAFKSCSNLTSITIPDNVTTIGNSAFNNCSELKEISLPNKLTKIGISTFNGCKSMTLNTDIPTTVTFIGESAFEGCEMLSRSLSLLSIKYISDNTFKGCISLTEVKTNDNIERIGNFAFYGCKELYRLNLPNNITEIGESAFDGCESYQGNYTLSYNSSSSLTTVWYNFNLPKTLIKIGKNCFKNTGITKVEYTLGCNILEGSFSECKNLQTVKISPSKSINIGVDAFKNCNTLKSLTISKISSIGKSAFENTSLSWVELPSELTKMGNNCFVSSKKIIIYIPENLNPPKFNKENDMPFGDTTQIEIHIPQIIINKYKSDTYWSKYSKYMKIFYVPNTAQ